jgi:hypothetical protein
MKVTTKTSSRLVEMDTYRLFINRFIPILSKLFATVVGILQNNLIKVLSELKMRGDTGRHRLLTPTALNLEQATCISSAADHSGRAV